MNRKINFVYVFFCLIFWCWNCCCRCVALNLNCSSIKVFRRFISNRLSQLNAGCAIERFESMSWCEKEEKLSAREKSKRQMDVPNHIWIASISSYFVKTFKQYMPMEKCEAGKHRKTNKYHFFFFPCKMVLLMILNFAVGWTNGRSARLCL